MKINKSEKLLRIFTVVLGIANIILGLFFILIIFMMQGFYLVLLGVPFIIFGIALFGKKFYNKLLLYGIIPVSALLSFNIIMMGISKDVPKYYHTPLWIGAIILLPFWLVIVADIYFLIRKNP